MTTNRKIKKTIALVRAEASVIYTASRFVEVIHRYRLDKPTYSTDNGWSTLVIQRRFLELIEAVDRRNKERHTWLSLIATKVAETKAKNRVATP